MFTNKDIVFSLILIFLAGLDYFLKKLLKKGVISGKETLLNLSIFSIGIFGAFALAQVFQYWSLSMIYKFSFFKIPTGFWTIIASFFLADFTYYWRHRIEHTNPLFWAGHSVHHSSTELNLSTALRLPWLSPFLTWIFLIPMVLIGFHPLTAIAANLFVGQLQFFLHTESVPKLGWVEGVFNTPQLHRIHHSMAKSHVNKNFGGILIVWDRVFNTYQSNEADMKYGIEVPVNSQNPFLVNSKPIAGFLSSMLDQKGVFAKFRFLLKVERL